MEDYAAFVDKPESSGDLSQLHELAEQQAQAEAEVARIEAELNGAKERLKQIAEVALPAAMDELGLTEFKTTSGLIIVIAETIRASIPKARQAEAFDWLRARGHANLIKRQLSISFGKGEDELADKALDLLIAQHYDPEVKTEVHTQTLGALVREKLEAGEDLPLELFGVFRQRSSKIEVPKVKKPKK